MRATGFPENGSAVPKSLGGARSHAGTGDGPASPGVSEGTDRSGAEDEVIGVRPYNEGAPLIEANPERIVDDENRSRFLGRLIQAPARQRPHEGRLRAD